jgi:hypothetical protein
MNTPVPIVCSRHRLPSFQWLDNGDGADSVTAIELIDTLGESYNAPIGFYSWTNNSFDTFTSSGLDVTSAIVLGASNKVAYVNPMYARFGKIGETVRVKGTLTYISSGTAIACKIYIYNEGGGESYNEDINAGDFEVTYTLTLDSVFFGIGVSLASGWGPKNFTITNFEVTIDRINQLFPTLPASHAITGDTYFSYEGDTLNYLLPEGIYYLKITMDTGHIYYSDWFKVDCVFKNLISAFTNFQYDTLTTSGVTILSAIQDGVVTSIAYSDAFDVQIGEVITIITNFTQNSGEAPTAQLNTGGGAGSDSDTLAAGLNIIQLTATVNGSVRLYIFTSNPTNWSTTEVLVMRSYSEKYLIMNFSNSCDLGDILYHEGFTQTIWFESETLEPSFPTEEEGLKDGEGKYIRTFARQVKKYLAKTLVMPDFMADVFYRMKLHDTVELVNLVGDVNDVYNLEVEHEWLFDDKYYVRFNLTFDYDEAFIIGGCCNNFA